MYDSFLNIFTILRKRELCSRIGLSSAQIYAMLDPKSSSYDPTFPKQIRLGASAVGWLEHEVQGWLEARVKLSREDKEEQQKSSRSLKAQKNLKAAERIQAQPCKNLESA
ncbi:AlpA family transcriptional regulator [Massilia sp. HP4]|uniref:helix-turn-helix transcriptional regulator n=1 Tax=Massilia sp. HP4 TaxID=2562316 RepID=UPI0010C098E8|nr:AlpA family phage regulatory protein [Massilia sp. HP4]